jgi:hypothetical protein
VKVIQVGNTSSVRALGGQAKRHLRDHNSGAPLIYEAFSPFTATPEFGDHTPLQVRSRDWIIAPIRV